MDKNSIPALFEQEPDTLAERPVDLDMVEAHQSRLQAEDRAVANNTRVAGQLERLGYYKNVLETFGDYNVSENFQNNARNGSIPLRTRVGREAVVSMYRGSIAKQDRLVESGHSQVVKVLNIKDLLKKSIITEEQAGKIVEATYNNYADRLRGTHNKKARTSELGEVERKIISTRRALIK